MSKDRPAGMDNMSFNQPKPTEKTPPRKNEMPQVVKAASGPVGTLKGIKVNISRSVD